MTNPLIKPNDPRFQRPSIADATGKNRFEEDPQAQGGESRSAAGDVFASPATAGKPYQPRYETAAPARSKLLLTLAILGLVGMGFGVLAIAGIVNTGAVIPLAAIVASGAAFFLGYSDLCEMTQGGRDAAGRGTTRLAMWLGLAGVLACVGMAVLMLWLELGIFPEV